MSYLGIAGFFAILIWLSYTSKVVFVTRVLDGDTVEALWRGRAVKIRLAGIDAPELSQNGGKQARIALERLCLHKWVKMSGIKQDKYGRIVAFLGGANAKLVQSGYAFAYMSKAFVQLEAQARKAGKFVHRLKIQKPWDYRKKPP